MRLSHFTAISLLASIAILGAAPEATAARGGIDRRELKSLVSEFENSETAESRRKEIVEQLRSAKPKAVRNLIARSLKTAGNRSAAVDLAIALQLPGLFREAVKVVDTDIEARALEVIAISGDKKATGFLVKRWGSKSLDSAAFARLHGVLTRCFCAPTLIERIHGILADKDTPADRAAKAIEVLAFQMVLDDQGRAALKSEWKRLYATFRQMCQPFPSQGRSLLADPGWKEGFGVEADPEAPPQSEPFRDRRIVLPRGVLRLPGVSLKNCTITLYLLPLSGDGCNVGVMMKRNSMVGARLRNGVWSINPSIRVADAPANVGQWTQMVFRIAGSNVTATINGTTVATTTDYGDQCNGILLNGGNSRLLLGGVHVVQN